MKLHISIFEVMPGVLFHSIARYELEIDDWVWALHIMGFSLADDRSEVFLLIIT